MAAIERGGFCKANPSIKVIASGGNLRDFPLSERPFASAKPARPFSRYRFTHRLTVLAGMLWVRATWAWVIPSSRAGRMIVKRVCACALWSFERAVSGTDDTAIISSLPSARNHVDALLPSIADRSRNCQNSAHIIPTFTGWGGGIWQIRSSPHYSVEVDMAD